MEMDKPSTEEEKTVQEYRLTVLLVDDQAMIAEAVRRALAEEDIDFHYCNDPTKAVQEANKIAPTLILQDLVMPEIDGLELVGVKTVEEAIENLF